MQGKPMNVEANSAKAIAKNDKLGLIQRVCRNPENNFERIFLLTDADADGVHTRALLLLIFDKLMPDLIESNRLWMVRAPMYSISAANVADPVFAYSPEQRDDVVEQMHEHEAGEVNIEYFKSVASMNADDLWTTCLNPDTRAEFALTSEHAAGARRAFNSARPAKL